MPAKKLISSWHARYLIFFGLAVIVIAVFFILLAPYSQLHASINSINFKYRFTLYMYIYCALYSCHVSSPRITQFSFYF